MSATSIMAGLQPVHELVQWRGHRLTHLLGQMRVDGGGGGRGMAEDRLDDAQIDSGLQQVCRKGMSQGVYMGGLAHAAFVQCTPESPLQRRAGDGTAVLLHAVGKSVTSHRREEPDGGTMR